MRQCRKAGLVPGGVKWIKYACQYEPEIIYSGYTMTDWTTLVDREVADGEAVFLNGYEDYYIDFVEGLGYRFFFEGSYGTLSAPSTGTRYSSDDAYEEISKRTLYRTEDGRLFIKSERAYLTTHTHVNASYIIGEEIGCLYCVEGEIPDKGSGYRYVGSYGRYRIRMGDDACFAYLRVE